jgi:hypothetical protein
MERTEEECGEWSVEKLWSEETRRLIIRVAPHLEILEPWPCIRASPFRAKMEEPQWWADGL